MSRKYKILNLGEADLTTRKRVIPDVFIILILPPFIGLMFFREIYFETIVHILEYSDLQAHSSWVLTKKLITYII